MNLTKWKHISAIVIPQLFTTLAFFIAFMFYGLYISIAVFLFALVVFTLVGRVLMQNPFTRLMEGAGILAIDITSTGILRPFIVGLQKSKYLTGGVGGNKVKGIFNRQAVTQMNAPVEVGNHASITEDKEGKTKLYFNIDVNKYNASRFQLNSFPTLLYNSQIDSILTKDFLSEQEKNVFAEHTLLYLTSKLDELTSLVRDFGRGVVESLKPKTNIFNSWITWVIIIIFLGVMAAIFGAPILDLITNTASASQSATTATTSAITPVT